MSNSQDDQQTIADGQENRPRQNGYRPPRPKRYPCPECDRWFDRPSALNLHMLSHTGEKPHACPRCGSRFTTTSNLNRHMKTCGTIKWARPSVPDNFASTSAANSDQPNEEADAGGSHSGAEFHTKEQGDGNELEHDPTEPASPIDLDEHELLPPEQSTSDNIQSSTSG